MTKILLEHLRNKVGLGKPTYSVTRPTRGENHTIHSLKFTIRPEKVRKFREFFYYKGPHFERIDENGFSVRDRVKETPRGRPIGYTLEFGVRKGNRTPQSIKKLFQSVWKR